MLLAYPNPNTEFHPSSSPNSTDFWYSFVNIQMQKTKHRNLLLTPIRPSTCRTSGALSPIKYTSVELYCFVLFYIRLVVLHDESVLCNCIGILCSASERPLEAGEGKHLKLGKFNLSLLLTAPCGGRGGVCVQKTDKVWGGTLLKEKQASPPFSPFSTCPPTVPGSSKPETANRWQ